MGISAHPNPIQESLMHNNAQSTDQNIADTWEQSVSAWVDGEAPIRPEELDSPYGRQLWDPYHLIGDVMRSQELAIKPSERFYARASKAIDEAPTVVAPGRGRKGARRRRPGRGRGAAVGLAT